MTTANVTVIQPTMKEDTTIIRVAAYCRVSSDSTDQLNSYMAQIRYYENFLAESEDNELVGIYADEGITGTRMDKRDEFLKLMQDCHRGKIDRVITKSISRFSRNTKECLTCVRELTELGVTIMFEKEGIDTAEMSDEILITIMGGLAQEESNSISNNVRWGIHKRMKHGIYRIATSPYGFEKINGKLKINEVQATIVKEIFRLYLNGYGADSIARILNSENIKTSTYQEKWFGSSIKYILKNERYIGNTRFRKTYFTETLPYRKKYNKGEKEQYYVENSNLSIIDKDDFYKVQCLLNARGTISEKYEYLLSKKIICFKCGTIFKRKMTRKKVYWVCYQHDENANLCESKQIPEQAIYSSFVRMYHKLKLNYKILIQPLITQLEDFKNKKFLSNISFLDISKEIAQMKEQTHVLTRLKTKGYLDEGKYLEQSSEINAKIYNLTKKLNKITHQEDKDEVIDQIKDLAELIDNGTNLMTEFDEVMFENMVEKIVLLSQTEIEFQLYGGLKLNEKI